jgi:hypothetical protein
MGLMKWLGLEWEQIEVPEEIVSCSICGQEIKIKSYSMGWASEGIGCVKLWNQMFPSKKALIVCGNHKTKEIEDFAIENDCKHISNGFNWWDIK